MAGLQESLISAQSGSGSPGDQSQTRKAASLDDQHFDEARFRNVLKELKDSSAVSSVKDFKSGVYCSCPCSLGVIVGLRNGSVVLVGLDAEIKELGKHLSQVNALSEANGKVVSGSTDKTVGTWDLRENMLLAFREGHTDSVECVAISSDGEHIVSGSKDTIVRLWDGEDQAELHGHTDRVKCISISPSGSRIVSGSDDKTVRIWDLENRAPVLPVLAGHTQSVNCISISLDEKYIISGSSDRTVRVWDFEERKQLAVLEGHTSIVNWVSISSKEGNEIISGSEDFTVRIWDLEKRKQLAVLEGHSHHVTSISILSDGKYLVSGSQDNTSRIWDLDERKQVAVLEGHTQGVNCVAFMNDGKQVVSGSDDETVRVWKLEVEKQPVLTGHSWCVNSVSISDDGKYAASGSKDRTVRIWSLEERKEVTTLRGHFDIVSCVSISSDGKLVVFGSVDKTVRIWDIESREELACLEIHVGNINCISFSSDGKNIVSGSSDCSIRVWDVAQREPLYPVLEGHTSFVCSIAISSDGKNIVSGSNDKTVRIWSLDERKLLAVLEGHSGSVNCVAISNDGKEIVSGSDDKTVRIWDFIMRRQLAVLEGHSAKVRCISISGNYIVSGADDNMIRVWYLAEGKPLAVLPGHGKDISCLSLTKDGKQVVYGSQDAQVHILDLTMAVPTLRSAYLSAVFQKNEPSPSKHYYFCGQYQEILKQGRPLASSVASSPILPHYFNGLHICAYYNQFTGLKAYLEQSVPILRGVFGSPLTVALMKNSTKCINVILQHLVSKVKTESGLLSLQEVVEDFPRLLLCNASALIPFFKALLIPPTQYLPEFIVPLEDLPFTRLQTSQWVDLCNFAEFEEKDQVKQQNGEIVKFLISSFHWNFALGSVQSLKFLRALEDCEDRRILTTPLIASLIQTKWDKLFLVTQIHTLLYVCSLLCLVCLTFHYFWHDVLSLVFLCLNVLFLICEIWQMLSNGKDYWEDQWNYVDLVRGVTSVTWGYLVFRGVESQYLQFAVVSPCFLRGFTFFRTFKMTRVFVRLVIEVVKQMYAFLVILAYSTISFGMMYAVLIPEITGRSGAWTNAYELLMGSDDENGFDLLTWLCFTAAYLVNVIIMLNLLISILGDAYEKAQMSASENDNLEMLKLVIEYESMLFWRHKVWEPSVLVVCKSVGDEDTEDEWIGRLEYIKRVVEKNTKDTQTGLEKKLDAIEKSRKDDESNSGKKLEERLEKMEVEIQENRRVMEENRRVVESKFDQVLAALWASH